MDMIKIQLQPETKDAEDPFESQTKDVEVQFDCFSPLIGINQCILESTNFILHCR